MTLEEKIRLMMEEANKQTVETEINEDEQDDDLTLDEALGLFNDAIEALDLSEEELEELSKQTLSSYAHKASAAAVAAHPDQKRAAEFKKRHLGANKAFTKLTKENAEDVLSDLLSSFELDEAQIDEISKATLGSYIKKAGASRSKLGAAQSDQESRYQAARDAYHSVKTPAAKDALSAEKDDANAEKRKLGDKDTNRARGIHRAVTRLTKEDVSSEAMDSLLEAEGLSEEFKVKAQAMFEGAIADRVLAIEEELTNEYQTRLEEEVQELSEKIDGSIDAAVEKWIEENKVELAESIKSSRALKFVDGVMALMKEHNMNISEEEETALQAAEKALQEADETKAKLEEQNAELVAQINAYQRKDIITAMTESMTDVEAVRFNKLIESVEFKSEENFKAQLEVIKENFVTSKETTATKAAPVTESAGETVDPYMASILKELKRK